MKRSALAILLLLPVSAGVARAQTLTIRVVTDSGKTPVVGAIVRVLRGDSTVAQGLTEAGGRLQLKLAGPGKYLLRAGRIGYVPPPPTPIELAAGEARSIDLSVTTRHVNLPTISVTGEQRCGHFPDERALSAVIWGQVRDALAATQILEARGQEFIWARFERQLTSRGTLVSERVHPERRGTGRPFMTFPPAELIRSGFITKEGDTLSYSAPDANLLLYEPFVITHCFAATPPPDSMPGYIGLSFEPTDDRKLPEIRGVLWVERSTAALAWLEYHYVNTSAAIVRSNSGGRIRFSQFANAGWYISDWQIVMPMLARVRGGLSLEDGLERDSLVGYWVQGGLARPVGGNATASAATAPAGPAAHLTGRVDDSLHGGGLAGVVVRVAGVNDSAVTDGAGHFTLEAPVVGSRFLSLSHPLLDRFPDRTSRIVEFAAGAPVEFSTGLPTAKSVAVQFCEKTGASGLAGVLLPIPGKTWPSLKVEARWTAVVGNPGNRTPSTGVTGVRESYVSTDGLPRGLWVLCDVPPGPVTVTQLDGTKPVARWMGTVEREKFLWVEFTTLSPPP